MARAKKFGKRKFIGNQHQKRDSDAKNVSEPKLSASAKKIFMSDNSDQNSSLNNIIIQVETLSQLLRRSVNCKFCHNSDCMIVEEEFSSRRGLCVSIAFKCTICGNAASTMSSPKTNEGYEINIRMVYGMRCIGKGRNAAETLCAVLNLPPPPTNFKAFHGKLLNSLQHVSNNSMVQAVEETVTLGNVGRDITAAFDGSWQKRGHSSLNSVASVTSLETGKVLDFECITKHCSICQKNTLPAKPHDCHKNYEGYSGGMESEGVIQIFKRSIDTRGVRYINYLGDGDSKAYENVKKDKIYGEDVIINKMECIGHVQKRMGTRLRTLKKKLGKTKLSDNKSISGRGRLTDAEILLLQRYYGLAIRRNENKTVSDMVKSIWAIYFHKLSTDEVPQHGMCPSDSDTWCGYHKALNSGEVYTHKNSLPEAVMNAIKPIFRALTNVDLLGKCLHGKTQNPNESFNNCIWERLPKTTFHGPTSLKMGVLDAVICFNDGAQRRLEVMEHLGINPGSYMTSALILIDKRRIYKANRAAKSASKEARQQNRAVQRKSDHIQKMDKSEYGPGEF